MKEVNLINMTHIGTTARCRLRCQAGGKYEMNEDSVHIVHEVVTKMEQPPLIHIQMKLTDEVELVMSPA